MTGASQADDIQIALVAAVAENGIIGRDGDMPWRLRDDLAWFKKVTLGKPIVMGRKTFLSIGKALPGRPNIVVTRQTDFSVANVQICHELDTAVALARGLAKDDQQSEICIIGGGEIYQQMLARADRLYLTRVHAQIDGDTLFPTLNPDDWAVTPAGTSGADERNSHACSFFIFDRKPSQ